MYTQTLRNISLSILHKDSFDINYSNSPELASIAMSLDLLFKIFGRKWMSDNILSRKYFELLQNDANNYLVEYKFQNRILTLGECLYNLREIEGIENLLQKLNERVIDPIISELESGRLIYHRGLDFKYVRRKQKKGEDFDIHIIDRHHEIFCETKCKIDSTKFSEITYYDSLERAFSQLPQLNNPLIIFIKIPFEWGQYENELKRASNKFVEKISQPLGIICWRDHWYSSYKQSDTINKCAIGFEVHNARSKIFNSNLIPFLPSTHSPKWTEFRKFAAGLL